MRDEMRRGPKPEGWLRASFLFPVNGWRGVHAVLMIVHVLFATSFLSASFLLIADSCLVEKPTKRALIPNVILKRRFPRAS
jgi:hypothetical protein